MFCQNILGDLAKYMERELALVFIGRNKTNDVTCYPNKLFENDFKLHGQENHGREGMVMPNEVFKNPSNDFTSNIKESVDVTFATDDDKQLEAHNKTVTN